MQTEFEIRVKHIYKTIWMSLRDYKNRKLSRQALREAKDTLREITTAALYLYLDMMKYTTELSFRAEGCRVGAGFHVVHMEDILGVSPKGDVRLIVSPPLYVETSCDNTSETKQVLRRAQVTTSVPERQAQTVVEKAISTVYTVESDHSNIDLGHYRNRGSRGNEIGRRDG
jgi:hypothetical protein